MLYIFNKNDELLDIIEDFYSDELARELNGNWTYKFTIDIAKGEYVTRKNKVGFFLDDEFLLFTIEEVECNYLTKEGKTLYCEHDYYSIRNHIIIEMQNTDYTITQALSKALEGTSYLVGECDDFENKTTSFYFESSLNALNKVANTYGAEIYPRIVYDDETNTLKKYIDLKYKIGRETGLRFTYDTNIESIKRNEVPDNHYNVLYGRGASITNTNESGVEFHSRLINFGDVVWNISDGKPIDKPLGQKYIEDQASIDKYGRLEGIFENTDIEDTEELLQATYNALQETKEPYVSYEIDVNEISNIDGYEHYKYKLGDIVIILDDEYDINLESRILKEVISLANDTRVVTLGYILPTLSSENADITTLTTSNSKDIDDEDFPNILPSTPILSLEREGYASVDLSWTYENKPYYTYELYHSINEGFTPTINHLIWKGKASSFSHSLGFNLTGYYKVRCVNSHGQATEYSNEVSATTYKINDGTEVFDDLAIGNALIADLNADKINAGKVKGEYINAKNLEVTDGNNNVTFSIDSNGLVELIQGLIEINKDGIRINLVDSEGIILGYVLYDGQGVQIFDIEDNAISTFAREGSYIDKLQVKDIDCNKLVKVATRSGCPLTWYIGTEATGDGSGRSEENKATSLNDVIRRIGTYGLKFNEWIRIYIDDNVVLNENIILQDIQGTLVTFYFGDNVVINTEKFVVEDVMARVEFIYNTDTRITSDDITQAQVNVFPIIKATKEDFMQIANVSYVKFGGIRFRGVGTGSCIRCYAGSKVLIDNSDISNFEYATLCNSVSDVVLQYSRGNVDKLALIDNGATFKTSIRVPKCADSTNLVTKYETGVWFKQNSYNHKDTMYQEATTPTPSTNTNEGLKITNLYTKTEGTGISTSNRNGYTGQGRYQNYKTHRGYIILNPTEINSIISGKENVVMKLKMTRLNTSHGYGGSIPHPIIRAKKSDGTYTSYWDTGVTFARGQTNIITLNTEITDAIKSGATRLELWAESNRQQQYSFYNEVELLVEYSSKNNEVISNPNSEFNADELYEIAKTYWTNCDNESGSAQSWNNGTVYRSSNTPMSNDCDSSYTGTNSLWENCNGNYYKAIDCSTLVNMALRGWSYSEGAYSSLEKFNQFRADRGICNSTYSWTFAPKLSNGQFARTAAALGEYFYENNMIVDLDTIGNSSDNYSGLQKGDLLFYARKNSDGTYKQPDRFMKISHVAIVGDLSTNNGKRNLIESTSPTIKKHTVNGTEFNAGVYIGNIEGKQPETMVMVARLSKTPTLTEVIATARIKASVLNVRSGSSTAHNIIGSVTLNQIVEIVAKDVDTGWYKIRYNDGYGWISNNTKYVEIISGNVS